MKYNDNFEEIFEKETSNIKIQLEFYRKLINTMNKNQSEFDYLTIENMLAYEYGKQDFTYPSKFISDIKEKYDNEVNKLNELNILNTKILSMFNSIKSLLDTNPKDMKKAISDYCSNNNLDVNEFKDRLNSKKIVSITNTLWNRDFNNVIENMIQDQKNNSHIAEEKETFLKALKLEEEKINGKRKVADDFLNQKRRDVNRDPEEKSEYTKCYEKFFNTYIDIDAKTNDQSQSLSKEEMEQLRKATVYMCMREAKEEFTTNLDKYTNKIKDVKVLNKI